MASATGRAEIEKEQLKRLRRMLQSVAASNEFYRNKLLQKGITDAESLDDLAQLPFTTKSELVENQSRYPPYGTNLTFPVDRYIRIHQTSGTTGKPMYWLDTEESWNWWAECWKVVFEGAGVRPGDRIFFAFSFGPFIGFWAGWEGARKLGALAISGGAQSTAQRLKSIVDYGATVLVCTPTYALHLASEAKKAGMDPAKETAIKITIHAGEPGASIPSTKKLIEESWGANATTMRAPPKSELSASNARINPAAFTSTKTNSSPKSSIRRRRQPIEPGAEGELVITNLGRIGSPLIRYRIGDLVRPNLEPCPCGRPFMLLDGGVLGRADDMTIVRGVNVFPSAVENLLREFPDIEEFRVEISAQNPRCSK